MILAEKNDINATPQISDWPNHRYHTTKARSSEADLEMGLGGGEFNPSSWWKIFVMYINDDYKIVRNILWKLMARQLSPDSLTGFYGAV